MKNWIVKAKKKIDTEPQYEKGQLAWDGKPFEMVLSSLNSSEKSAEYFAEQVRKYDVKSEWKVWVEQNEK
jgi:hypothetical protein